MLNVVKRLIALANLWGSEFVGKQVSIKLAEKVYAEGILQSIDEWGEAIVLRDDGLMWYCWPALEIELKND